MNDPRKALFARLTIPISLMTRVLVCSILATMAVTNSHAAPCFDSPQKAYDYLLSQEAAKTQAREQYIVNINRANEGELVSLDGIGSSKAQAIILYREMFGGFTTVDELSKVKGIGEKTVEKNRRRLSVQD
ncbi:ComEA family DNA-binding protein [Psychrobacter sp. NG27]|uniref:ComEA family DNA-binding protein n=1 Tax=Psychrobacter sp. NG27 TaxID=2781966 RepID=UPI0018E03D0F|nr:ComEA family DNA-binding protein [Psychrobacter sp. NG27]MBI0425848.1 ComEA family DNA-binding protein [Psychrobacter sp. NG27]